MRAQERLARSDLDLLPVEVDDDGLGGRVVLDAGLVRHDGALYGGTGLAVTVLAMEAPLGRDVLWASTQFVTSPRRGTELRWTTEVLAEGKRAAQLLVTARHDGGVAFTSVGSVGVSAEDGLTGQWRTMPDVGPPEGSEPWGRWLPEGAREQGWGLKIDLRDAEVLRPDGVHAALWARRHDGQPFTPAAIAFAADFVPLGVARAAGKLGAGSSLDNSMRFRPGTTTEWILLEVTGHFAHGGYGHGEVAVWGQDGTLVAVGSQSAAMRYLFSEGEPDPRPGMDA